MGYKVLGYIVWQGAKLYIRRRTPDSAPKLAIASIAGAALVGGIIAVQRRSATN
jgi:hypothetical protein